MAPEHKMQTGLKICAFAGALALAACGEEGKSGEERASLPEAPAEEIAAIANYDGEDVVEPVVEEAAIRSGDPATDDVEFIYRLGLIRGHLAAFLELYRVEAFEMAASHVKHPESELYQDLVPAFEARDTGGFAQELGALADISAQRGDVDEIYANAITAIRAEAPAVAVSTKLLAVSKMLATAAEEFEAGVADDGAIGEPHEYQDAFGFLTVAREMLAAEGSTDINEAEAIAVSHEQLDLCLNEFSGLLVDNTEGRAETIYAAAAVIERAALRLR